MYHDDTFTKKKKSIGIDLDSTLNNLLPFWIDLYNEKYNDNLNPNSIIRWDTHEFVKPECGLAVYDLLDTPNLFYDLDVIPYAQEVTQWLSERYDLYIVTAYHSKVCVDKTRWIEKYFPHINSRNIIFCNNKGMVCTDYLIDDAMHNIEAFKGIGLLLDKPYNQVCDKECTRVDNWLDVFDYFQVEHKNNY